VASTLAASITVAGAAGARGEVTAGTVAEERVAAESAATGVSVGVIKSHPDYGKYCAVALLTAQLAGRFIKSKID
jgi:hypothetical protein